MKELFEKPATELTVNESLKVQAVILVGMMGVAFGTFTAIGAVERIKQRRHIKNLAKLVELDQKSN